MITVETVEQALMDAGFAPTTHRPGIVYGGFKVTPEDDGVIKVTHVMGEYTGMRTTPIAHRRKNVGSAVSRMERELSRKGFKVTMFQPDEGTGFWLRVRPKD
jgi:hypothetical protein